MQESNNVQSLEEEKIDLKEFVTTIWQGKFIIAIFALIMTAITTLYVLKQPNSYTSSTTLILKEGGSSASNGASALAAMAGINIGGGGDMDAGSLYQLLLSDYPFHKYVIKKYNLEEMISLENTEKNYVFAAGKDQVYHFFKSSPTKKESAPNQGNSLFGTYLHLKSIISLSVSKDGVMILSATLEDRFVAKKLVDIYLREMSEYVKKLDLKEIDDQLRYYEKELTKAKNLDLKSNINELISALVKKKVLSQAGEFYMVKQLSKPQVPHITAKAGPKRAPVVLLALIASIILGVAFVLLQAYLKGNEDRESELSF